MSINFPNTPQPGDEWTDSGASWTWDGAKWEATTFANDGPYLPLAGGMMAGMLTLFHTAPTAAYHATPKNYVDLFAPLNSPILTGNPTGPTRPVGDNSASLATTAFVSSYAPLASPIFIGNPRAPTPALGDNTTTIPTTAWVKSQGYGTALAFLPLTGGTLTGFLYISTGGSPVHGSTAAGFGATRWSFAVAPSDEISTGTIDYRGFDTGALSIIGAGTDGSNRRIRLWDNVLVSNTLTVGGGGISAANTIASTGGNAIITWTDRTSGVTWGWYASGGLCRLWDANIGDMLSMSNTGNLTHIGNYHYFSNSGGNVNSSGGNFIYSDPNWTIFHIGTGNQGVQVQDTNGNARHLFYSGGNAYHGGPLSIQGNNAVDSLLIYRSGGTAYMTFKPETGGNWSQIGYYGSSFGWGGIEFPGPVQFDSGFTTLGNLQANGYVVTNNLYLWQSYIFFMGQTSAGPNHWANNTDMGFRLGSGNGTFYFQNVNAANNCFIGSGGDIYGATLRTWGGGDWGASTGFASFSQHIWRFAISGGDGGASGTVSYRVYDSTALCIVGADSGGVRHVHLWDDVVIDRNLQVNGGNIYLPNSSGTGVNIVNAGGNWLHVFDDGNAHLETNTRLWVNQQTGTDVWFGGPVITNSNYFVWVNGSAGIGSGQGPCMYGDNNWIIAKLGSGNSGFAVADWYANWNFRVDSAGSVSCANVTVSGSLFVGGLQIYNNGGWVFVANSLQAGGLYSRGDIWNAGSINSGNQLNCPNACTAGYLHSTSDVKANGWFTSGIGNGGAQVRCWAGDWGAMSFAISNQYFEISPDQGQSGFYYAPAGNWSDARLKYNIRDTEVDALAVICATPVRRFEWNERGRKLMPNSGSDVLCGFVAQEIEEVISIAVDAVPLLGGGMKRVVDEHLTPYLFRAIQQLTKRIAVLEDRLASTGNTTL